MVDKRFVDVHELEALVSGHDEEAALLRSCIVEFAVLGLRRFRRIETR